MRSFPGFEGAECLYESAKTCVFRARRVDDGATVILKATKDRAGQSWFRQQFDHARRIRSPHVVRAIELRDIGADRVVVFEDIGAISLEAVHRATPLEVIQAVRLLRKVAVALRDIHAAGVIHKDIKPTNIVVNLATDQLNVIDFGTSTTLAAEDATAGANLGFKGSLAYVSPEQTGRMNRPIDHRTDFYSLGVTAYQLLTGRLPFESSDPLELLHAHLAKTPVPPAELRRDVPRALSDLVLRLMQKNPEERYESAEGIIHDLERCMALIEAGTPAQPLVLAERDVPRGFRVSQKFYGRTAEIQRMGQIFEKAVAGEPQVLMVSGYSGIGKSALISELYKPITRERGYFAAGKFDQLQRNVPYSAIAAALRGLVRQLLAESDERLAVWRGELARAVGTNGQVLVDVLVEVEHILGPQPPVPTLGALETRHRFHAVFQSFMAVVCTANHPLTLFLDDMQWVDAASLKLLAELLFGGKVRHWFFIGSYRDNEVTAAHPLMLFLAALQTRGIPVETIELGPLARADVQQLCADSLAASRDAVDALASLVFEKTAANPFFVSQFLRTLHTEGFIHFDREARRWAWEVDAMRTASVTDNVADLLAHRIRELPEATRTTLQIAACLGANFDLQLLAALGRCSLIEAASRLRPALDARLVANTSSLVAVTDEQGEAQLAYPTYKFLHDRMQEAAYVSIVPTDVPMIHLQTARIMLEQLSADERAEHLFGIVDHLNAGSSCITNPKEAVQRAQLNLEAGLRAKKATAYAAAREYLRNGIAAVDTWEVSHELGYALRMECAEVEYLVGSLAAADQLVEEMLTRSRSSIDKARAYKQRIWQYTLQMRHDEVLRTGRQALAALDIHVPETDIGAAIGQEFATYSRLLAGREVASLIDLPTMTNERVRLAMEILAGLQPSAYMTNQEMYAFMDTKMVNLSLEYGNCPESSSGYGTFGIVVWAAMSDYRTAYQLGKLAWDLSERYGNDAQKCKDGVHFGTFVLSWIDHTRDSLEFLDEGYKAGVDSGELQWAGYNLHFKTVNMYYLGTRLDRLASDTDKYMEFFARTNNEVAASFAQAVRMAVWNLLGRTSGPDVFADDVIDEAEFGRKCAEQKTQLAAQIICAAEVLFVLGHYDRALEYSARADHMRIFMPGIVLNATQTYVYSLALLQQWDQRRDNAEREALLSRVGNNQARLKAWADSCPENFQHLYALVEAELARVRGDRATAMDRYDEAVSGARRSGYVQHDAIACELAARFWRACGKEFIADSYAGLALQAYAEWGAARKVEALRKEVRPFASTVPDFDRFRSTDGTTSATIEVFDLHTILKASQAISSEVHLEGLLTKLLTVVMESAGAERGAVILVEEDRPVVRATREISSDVEIGTGELSTSSWICPAIPQFTLRTGEFVLLDKAARDPVFGTEPVIVRRQPKSLLCMPLTRHGRVLGAVYLEHSTVARAFSGGRLQVLDVLAAQAAISVDNARLYLALKARNEDLGVALRRAQENARLKGAFLANTSHELRTPLNSIINVPDGVAEHVERVLWYCCERCGIRYDLPAVTPPPSSCPGCGTAEPRLHESGIVVRMSGDDFDRYMNLVRLNGKQLLGVVNDILDMSKLDAGRVSIERQVVSLKQLIREVMESMASIARGRSVTLQAVPISDDPRVYGDPVRIRQILSNLVDNAMKFSHVGGVVELAARTDGESVVLSVRDEGIGIAPQHQARIFESFYQADGGMTRRSGGTGLGLSIAQQLVDLHGGAIWVQSAPDEGSTFFVRLPRLTVGDAAIANGARP